MVPEIACLEVVNAGLISFKLLSLFAELKAPFWFHSAQLSLHLDSLLCLNWKKINFDLMRIHLKVQDRVLLLLYSELSGVLSL